MSLSTWFKREETEAANAVGHLDPARVEALLNRAEAAVVSIEGMLPALKALALAVAAAASAGNPLATAMAALNVGKLAEAVLKTLTAPVVQTSPAVPGPTTIVSSTTVT